MRLGDHFVNTVADELDHLNGSEFEELCRAFIELLTGKEFEIKGHNLEMKPVRGSVDLIQDEDFKVIGQCGTDKDYFTGGKPVGDIESSINNSPDFRTIYLFCNRRAQGNDYQNTKASIWKKLKDKKKSGYHYHLYDSQRIAKKIYNNIFKAKEVEEILSYLPKSYEYYLILPQTNSLPLLNEDYKTRPEEDEIIQMLETIDFVQVYGLSGIGKSMVSLAIAEKLNSQYETVFWLDGSNIDPSSLSNVTIKRMGEEINIKTAVELYKTLIIVDNLNEGVSYLQDYFTSSNKKGSKCIVTSLQRNISIKNSYNLKYISEEVSRAILMECDIKPSENQIEKLLSQISGYPLLLELAKKAVDNWEMTWDDIINESNLTNINDTQRNEVFAQRVLGRYVLRFGDVFNHLMFLDETTFSKSFLRDFSIFKYNDLLTYSIIHETGEYQSQIHQVVLSAIKVVVGKKYDINISLQWLGGYLQNHIKKRDAGLHTFMSFHHNKIWEVVNTLSPTNDIRHYALLAILYTEDTYLNHDYYISQIDALKIDISQLDVDLSLQIERVEIEQNKIRQQNGEDSEEYRQRVYSYIDYLSGLNCTNEKAKALILHHIGKLRSYIGDVAGAEQDFLNALELDPRSYHSMLRLAHDFDKQGCNEKAEAYIEKILETEPIDDVPISIRLSAYDLISLYKYKDLKEKFINNHMKEFSDALYAALSENYSHVYVILSKLSGHLSYNYPDYYTHICARLPLPLNVECNERIKKDYGKIIAAQFIYGNYKGKYKDKLFRTAEYYLSSISKKDDYIRKNLAYLYLAAEMPEKALQIAAEIEKTDDIFNKQVFCKVYYGNGEYKKAKENIEQAIAHENPEQKEYCAAFRHDKAECLYKLGDSSSKDVMIEAIKLQTNEKLKKEWLEELATW